MWEPAAGAAVLGVSILVLVGWATDRSALAGVGSGLQPVPPLTAVALAAASAALLLLHRRPGPRSVLHIIGHALGALSALLGGIGLMQHAGTAVDDAVRTVGVTLMGPDAGPYTRPTWGAALAITLCGLALAMLDLGSRGSQPHDRPGFRGLLEVGGPSPRDLLAPAALTLAVVAALGQVFVAASLPSPGPLLEMPTHTWAAIVLVAAGTMVARPERVPLSVILRAGPAGVMARRLIPAVVAIPFGVGLLILLATRVARVSPAAAVTASTLLGVAVLGAVFIGTVRALDRADAEQCYLLATHQRAEGELTARATDLADANDRLRTANEQLLQAGRFKTDMMAVVSHEMSQPLASMASMSELLTAEWDFLSESDRLDLARKFDRNTRRLAVMHNDVNLLFRLDAGMVSARRTPVAVAAVVETVVDGLPRDTPVAVRVDGDLRVLVDRNHLSQMVTNLLGNALRYGSPPVEVAARREADQVVLTVRDHGEGIPVDVVPHLFERFLSSRVIGRRTEPRGSGLGLYIVRQLADLNAATVSYEQATPTGARIIVRLEAISQADPA